jgi:site-specific DNA-cytosine methylase
MKVLIACEESGVVREAFLKLGHDAYSCDIIESSWPSDRHIQDDVLKHLEGWDLIIAFPPCTHLAVSGARHFKNKQEKQEEALLFVSSLLNAAAPKIALENPVGVISSRIRKPDQIIQPWMFGEPFQKTTCLWLKGLPKLTATNIVSKGEFTVFKSGKKHPKWYADALKYPPHERQRIRSKTFQGIANAMAEQWGGLGENITL